jgi:PPK2 family polyphosphate:nucleotide phosphotransferase
MSKPSTRPRLAPLPPDGAVKLRDRDARPPRGVPKGNAFDEALEANLDRMARLQEALYAEGRRALLVVLQARDTGGKDGLIRHVFGALSPQGCRVTSFGVPTPVELAHDFLWRVHQAAPPAGAVGVFNRSHYEDVLAARVHQLVPEDVWSQRYDRINDFERLLVDGGVTVLKFFLHISRDEQRERLLKRMRDPRKNWKFREGDLVDRGLWDEYTRAYEDALTKCSTAWAPWYVVPADKKPVRDFLVAEVVADTLTRMAPEFPRADPEALRRAERLLADDGEDEDNEDDGS